MSENERGIDLKYFIDEEIKNWYNRKITTFYFVITEDGEILFFSEDSLDFFGLKNIYDIEDRNIDNYIGKTNWRNLQIELSDKEQNDEYVILEEKIRENLLLKVIWKKFIEMEEVRYILVFKVEEENFKISDKEDLLYKSLLDKVSSGIALIKDNAFYYKNKKFNTLSRKLKFNTFNEFLNIAEEIGETINNNKLLNADFILQETNWNIIYEKLTSNYNYLIINEKNSNEQIQERIKEVNQPIEKNIIIEKLENEIANKNNLVNFLSEELLQIKIQILNLIKRQKHNTTQTVTATPVDLKYYFNKFEKIVIDTTNYLTKMSEIANFIEEISIKIHLISINAAIESARSGEAGKGFAVISREIAKLSDATKNHTKMIDKQIKEVKKFYLEQNIKSDFEGEKISLYIDKLVENDAKIENIIKNVKDSVIDKIDDILNNVKNQEN